MGAIEYEWVNPRSLEEARERLGLAPRDVADQSRGLGADYAGITEAAVVSWERGTAQPELRHLEALSEIYVCPVGWFFLPSIPSQPERLNHRGVARGAKIGGHGMQILSRFVELGEWAERIAIQTGQLKSPSLEHADLRADVESLAERERRRLGFDDGVRQQWLYNDDALNWWRRAIERLGVFCFVMRLPTSEVRGASFWGKHGAAFILVNSEDAEAATGRTFSLVHEYAHLILGEGYVCDFRGSDGGKEVERFANVFAARMLVGPDELTRRLQELGIARWQERWGDATIDSIREPFRVSRDVVAIYLEELQFAPVGFYAEKRASWAKRRGFGRGGARAVGRTLAVQKLRMVGSRLAEVLSSREAEASLSPLDLAEMLEVKVERVPGILSAFKEASGAR